MSEAEVVAELVNFTNILLTGVSVIFTVVSAYIAALNYFLGTSNFLARFMAFLFVSIILGMLALVMVGAQFNHAGLIARLYEIKEETGLSAAGRALLANSAPDALVGGLISIDDLVRGFCWFGGGGVFLALAYLSFVHTWRPDVIPVVLEQKAAR